MLFLRSSLFYIFLTIWTISCFILGSPVFLTFHLTLIRFVGTFWAKGALFALKLICNLEYKILGTDNLPPSPYFIASKHQSMWETIFITACIPNSVFILKKELMYIPFFGWYLKLAGMIAIDRKDGFNAIKHMVRSSQSAINNNRVIVIFPEGTRTNVNESRAYNPGIAALHHKYPSISIVPLALNSGLFWSKGLSLIKPGCITVAFLPAIEHNLNRSELLATLQKEIDFKSNILAKS